MLPRSLVLVTALLCLFAGVEPGSAQYSEACVRWCTLNHGAGMPVNDSVGLNNCYHNTPICTGQPALGRPVPKGAPAAAAGPTAAQRAACGADVAKFVKRWRRAEGGGGPVWERERASCHRPAGKWLCIRVFERKAPAMRPGPKVSRCARCIRPPFSSVSTALK